MAQREGSIYFYLFIIAMVLFSIMTTMFFITNADKQEVLKEVQRLTVQRDQAARKSREDKAKIEDLQTLIAGPNFSPGEQWPPIEHFLTNELKGKAQRAINLALKELGEAERNYDYLIEVYGDLESLFLKYREGRDEALKARDADNDALAKAKQGSDEAIAKLREEQAAALQRSSELESRAEDLDNKAKQEKAGFVREIEQLKAQHTEEKIKLTRELDFKKNQISNLQSRVEDLLKEVHQERTFDDIDPDGKLVNFLGSSGKGWIDLGRRNHLRNGLKFRVFTHVKAGKKKLKGYVEVTKVDETISEVRVVEETDSLDPITIGDSISSPFYDPDAQPVFVLAGSSLESQHVTRDYLIAKMKGYGAVVKDKVDLQTDYLVAIKDYESSPEYKAAADLNVTVIRERDLLEFIGR